MNKAQIRKNRDGYIGLKRVTAFLAAIGLWAVSVYFSYKGFEFESTTVLWFGLVMALVVTVVELVFNTKISQLNPTLLFTGVICYIYGIYTNVTGFYVLQHGDSLAGFFSGTNWLIPTFAGFVSEVLPEALLAWAIGAYDSGDLIGNIGEMFSDAKDSIPQQSPAYQNKSQQSYRPPMMPSGKQEKQTGERNQNSFQQKPEPKYHPMGMSGQKENLGDFFKRNAETKYAKLKED